MVPTDLYFSRMSCVNRLLREYNQHKSLIVAVDFDDTIFDYHKRGHTYDGVIFLLQRGCALNFKYVIYTARGPEDWEEMKTYFKEKVGCSANFVNCNPIPLPFGNWGKMYYNILLDDRAGLKEAYETLKETVRLLEYDTE